MQIPIASLALLAGLCFLPVVVVKAESDGTKLDLLILHNNDMHSRFEETARNSGTCQHRTGKNGGSRGPSGCVGGVARTAHEIRRYRKMAEDGTLDRKVLYLNAGDTYTGTAWFTVHKWEICADFMNALQPDAMCLGNHEFDNEVSGLVPFIDAVNFPILAANLNVSLEPSLNKLKKSIVLEISGRKIGIVGHLTAETKILSQSGNVIFDDVVSSVRAETEALDKAGVKIIIILGHAGFTSDKQIASQVPLADIVIGGHTNTFQWNGQQPDSEKIEAPYPVVVTQSSGKKVPVVQAYAYTKYLGRLNVTFDSQGDLIEFGGQPELLDTDIPQDQDVLDLLDKYRKEIDELQSKTIGKSRVTFEAKKCRVAECNFGNLITDAFVFYTATLSVGRGWNDAPIGLMNGGAIRTTIEPNADGHITKSELLGALPFASQIVTLKLNGSDLIRTLELGVRSNGETSYGEYMQFSGLKVVYDMDRPTGSRVVSVQVRCGRCRVPVYEPIDVKRIYNLTTTSFLTSGGDGHYVLKENGFDMKIQDLIDVDMVEFYINRQSPVYPEEQGRITILRSSTNHLSINGTSTTRAKISLILFGSILYFALNILYLRAL